MSPVTLSLILTKVDAVEQRLTEMSASLEKLATEQKLISNQALNLRVTKLEDNVRWLTRTVAGAVLTGIIAMLFALVATG